MNACFRSDFMAYDMAHTEGKKIVGDRQYVEIAKRIPLNNWKAESSGRPFSIYSAVDNETGMVLKVYKEAHGQERENYGLSAYKIQAYANGEKQDKCIGGALSSDYASRLFQAIELNCVRKE